MDLEEEIGQLFIRDLSRIKRDLKGLEMARGASTHALVVWVVNRTSRVPHLAVHQALIGVMLSVHVFDSPEASSCHCDDVELGGPKLDGGRDSGFLGRGHGDNDLGSLFF